MYVTENNNINIVHTHNSQRKTKKIYGSNQTPTNREPWQS